MRGSDDGYGSQIFRFEPVSVTITRGGIVTWSNPTSETHNVTFGGKDRKTARCRRRGIQLTGSEPGNQALYDVADPEGASQEYRHVTDDDDEHVSAQPHAMRTAK